MIYLLRHGETAFNLEGRYQGRLDSPLTARGIRQAEAFGRRLAEHVQPQAIWTSPLPRAQATTRLLAASLPGVAIREDTRLIEVALGQWDGLTKAEIARGWPGARRAHPPRQWMFHAPGGERVEALNLRLGAVLRAAAEVPGDLVLVSHGLTGRLIRGLHAGLPLAEAVMLEAPQDLIWCLGADGSITTLPSTGE